MFGVLQFLADLLHDALSLMLLGHFVVGSWGLMDSQCLAVLAITNSTIHVPRHVIGCRRQWTFKTQKAIIDQVLVAGSNAVGVTGCTVIGHQLQLMHWDQWENCLQHFVFDCVRMAILELLGLLGVIIC
jgi:hypothetical protein